MQHPRNPPNQKSQIPRYLTVQIRYKFKLRFWFNLNLYRGIWGSRFGGCRGSIIFSGNCHLISANQYCFNFSSVLFRGTNAPLFNRIYIHTYMKIYVYTYVDIYVCVYVYTGERGQSSSLTTHMPGRRSNGLFRHIQGSFDILQGSFDRAF